MSAAKKLVTHAGVFAAESGKGGPKKRSQSPETPQSALVSHSFRSRTQRPCTVGPVISQTELPGSSQSQKGRHVSPLGQSESMKQVCVL